MQIRYSFVKTMLINVNIYCFIKKNIINYEIFSIEGKNKYYKNKLYRLCASKQQLNGKKNIVLV